MFAHAPVMPEMSKPDRSDAHLPAEEEEKMEAQTREYFEGIAPRRHTKPSRSEYSAVYADAYGEDDSTPELDRFQQLQENPPQKMVCEGSQAVEEYVETDYYSDLNCIDRQHHTTGTGFIRIDGAKGGGGEFELAQACLCRSSGCHAHLKGNPATNEWIPSPDNSAVYPDSHKPKRSDL